jgi:uncharacterized protein (DUF362 family)/NAD-dependent dihydropyrimidine dehydrogenase PreA subunit
MNVVSIVRCENYENENVDKAIEQTFNNLGGISKIIKPGMKVLLKINLLLGVAPEAATTTHPALIEAIIRQVQKAGGIAIVADSPGGPYTRNFLKNVYKTCGILEVIEKTGALLNYDTSYKSINFEKGKVAKSFNIIKPVLDSDIIINIPKLKTHSMTYFTGAVKNLFGIIPGVHKAEYHFRMSDKVDFSNLLIDLCECIKPNISIMDAVIGMEGSGPSAGTPRKIGAIISSQNPYNLDFVAAKIINIKHTEVYTILKSIERGLCVDNLDKINIIGAKIEDFIITDFKMPPNKSVAFLDSFPAFIKKPIEMFVSPKPVFLHEKCIGCGICANNCPADVINIINKKPNIELNNCIKCFCCQELCPEKAVLIKRPWIMSKLLK